MNKITLEQIKEQYHQNDICMGELLASIPASGLTMEEAFELYIESLNWSDGDRFFRESSGILEEIETVNEQLKTR